MTGVQTCALPISAPPPKPAAQAAIKSQVRISLSIELPRGNIRLQAGEESRLTPFVVQSKKFCVFREDSVFFAIDVFPDHSFVKATNVEYASNASPENKTNLSADSYLVE